MASGTISKTKVGFGTPYVVQNGGTATEDGFLLVQCAPPSTSTAYERFLVGGRYYKVVATGGNYTGIAIPVRNGETWGYVDHTMSSYSYAFMPFMVS